MPEARLTSLILTDWKVSTQKMFLSVRRMAGHHTAQPAASSRPTERIIVGKLIDVREKWTISVLGKLLWLSKERSVKLLTDHRVGGVVSETSFKFFIQFVVYTAIFCVYLLIVSAYYTAEIRRNVSTYSPKLTATLTTDTFQDWRRQSPLGGLYWTVSFIPLFNCPCPEADQTPRSAMFAFFAGGMSLSSIQLAMLNLTTIENINRHSVVWTLAIRVPDHMLDRLWATDSPWAPTFRMVAYPLQPPTSPSEPQTTGPSPGECHVFAILHTLPGENPFSLGSHLKNLQQVMGQSILDWLLPLKHSPCADHSSSESAFALGPVVTRLKQEAGLVPAPATETGNGAVSRPPSAHTKRSRRGKDRS